MSRPLGNIRLAALMLDGIELKGRCCVVALGITTDGVKTPLGQVRLDRQKRGFAAVHIALTTNAQGRGVGRDALCQSRVEAARWPDVRELRAHIKPANERSLRAFAAAGFAEAARTADFVEVRAQVSARRPGRSSDEFVDQ